MTRVRSYAYSIFWFVLKDERFYGFNTTSLTHIRFHPKLRPFSPMHTAPGLCNKNTVLSKIVPPTYSNYDK